METIIYIKILQNGYKYGDLIVTRNSLIKNVNKEEIKRKRSRRKVIICINGMLLHYFIRELTVGPFYRSCFVASFERQSEMYLTVIQFQLFPVCKEILDYSWNEKVAYLVRERCELEHTLSWLSTLGGAFSALGDYFENCAETAGKISINQLKLAYRLRDENIKSRCRLYLSLSLIQRQRYKLAKQIIYNEFHQAKRGPVVDIRLINMCKGIWCKLKYEYEIYRSNKL